MLAFYSMKLTEYLFNNTRKPINLKKDQVLFLEGDECNSICYVKEGSISAERNFSDGHKTILRIVSKDEIIGLALLFSSNPYYTATFTATKDSIIYKITKNEILKHLQNDIEFANEFLSLVSNNSIQLNNHIRLLSYKTIREKLCYFFYSQSIINNSHSFRINQTKTELALLLNVERSSMSYELHKLIHDGIITNKGHNYTILNIKKIEEVI